jgi:hypothetical protein
LYEDTQLEVWVLLLLDELPNLLRRTLAHFQRAWHIDCGYTHINTITADINSLIKIMEIPVTKFNTAPFYASLSGPESPPAEATTGLSLVTAPFSIDCPASCTRLPLMVAPSAISITL